MSKHHNKPALFRSVQNAVLLAGGLSLAFGMATHAAAADTAETNIAGIRAVAAPPAGFDAVHASTEALAAYALPPRPDVATQPDAYAKWRRAMSVRTTRLAGDLTATSIYHGPMSLRQHHADVKTGNTTYTSGNWSGFANLNGLTSYSPSTSYYFLLADFVIPAATNRPCSGGWTYSSSWVGIDGFGSPDVLQAGTESDAYCSSSGTASYYSAWIEWYPYSESRISLPVTPGDDMFVEVWNTSATNGYAYVENINTGAVQEYNLTPPSGTRLVGNSAEWIVEAPTVGTQATLADYAYDFFWGAAAYNFNYNYFNPGSASSAQINMVQGGHTVSIPTLLNGNTIEFTYY